MLASVAEVEPLPLVPAMRTEGYWSWGRRARGEGAHVGEVELAAWGSGSGWGELVAEGVKVVDRCGVGR